MWSTTFVAGIPHGGFCEGWTGSSGFCCKACPYPPGRQRTAILLGASGLKKTTALARIPSVILSNTSNYLLNPVHLDAERIQILNVTQAELDPRLLKHLRG